MVPAKWRLKRLWMYPFVQTETGADLYEWLTAVVLGTQQGMSHKWCSWFGEHMALCRRFGMADVPGSRIWLFQPGWSLAPVFLSRMATGRGPLVTENRRRLATRYLPAAIGEVCNVAERLVESASARADAAGVLKALGGATSADEALRLCEADYRVGDMRALAAIPAESADICMSMGRLEHVSPPDLHALFAQMRRVLVPGGLGSHIVDHRDHYWHYDKSIHYFHHLTYSDQQWARLCGKGKGYRNRLLESDYVRLFEDAGLEVLAAIHLHKEDAEPVDPGTLWGPFANLTPNDLEAAVSHFVVRKA